MTTDWTELKDLQALALAQADGWEIEAYSEDLWVPWNGRVWHSAIPYRGRLRPPRKIVVTSECWRNKINGGTLTRAPGYNEYLKRDPSWQRFPAGDITGEVEE